jgi:hypothetical protein
MMQALLQKISLRELRLLIAGLGAVVTAAICVSLVVPATKELRSANAEVDLLEDAARDGPELERLIGDKLTRIDVMRKELYGDMADLPMREVEAYVIGRLQRVSWNNNIELVSVEPATGDRIQVFQELLFNVELAGQYEDLYRWLLEARRELGYLVVKEYELRRNDIADESPMLLAALSLASYRAVE